MLFIQAATARGRIAQTYRDIGVSPSSACWRAIAMGVKRDLQARRMRPNVPVPSRRQPLAFIKVMRQETGSLVSAVSALLHDGSWTSSGGSFRLAEELGIDMTELCEQALKRHGSFRLLEIGAGWAGLRSTGSAEKPRNIAELARRYENKLGRSVHLHMTNLTAWHQGNLPEGVVEHPYVTAGALSALERQGVSPSSCDVIYSQAAAYFEVDQPAFLNAAARLLRPGGALIYNHQPELAGQIDVAMTWNGMQKRRRLAMGGMNGSVVHYERKAANRASLSAYEPQPDGGVS